MSKLPNNKEAWLRRLQKTALPSFAQNIQKLSDTDQFVGSHASELSRIILKDPSLTASVLKLANSVQFNTYGNTIRTVSRGVMLIGHKSIVEICSSCILLEKFLKGQTSEILKAVLARSFHAAIQAKEIMNLRGDKAVEEVFISALLLNIGEISIYSSISPNDKAIKELAKDYPFEGGKERDIFGCFFNELTLSLCNSWGIAPMIAEALGGHYSEDSLCRSILLANSLASACEKKGIESAIATHAKSISRYTKKSPKNIEKHLLDAAQTAQKTLESFGLLLKGINEKEKIRVVEKPYEVVIQKDIQLDAIQEISSLAEEKFDLNMALQLILEGLARGAGFKNCYVGLYNPKRTRIVAKHAVEKGDKSYKQNFDFSCAKQIPEIQQRVLTHRNVIRSEELREKGKTLKEIVNQLQVKTSIWGPLVVKKKVVGCIYADNGIDVYANENDVEPSNIITDEQIVAFNLFVYQARLNFDTQSLV